MQTMQHENSALIYTKQTLMVQPDFTHLSFDGVFRFHVPPNSIWMQFLWALFASDFFCLWITFAEPFFVLGVLSRFVNFDVVTFQPQW